jgi:EmrB/QacA subfamily drug resistance transporter
MTAAIPAPCEAPALARGAAGSRGVGVLVTTILGSSIAFIDGSVVNVALPAMQSGLALSEGALQWIVNAYLLPLSALMLLGGVAGDRFGRRNVFVLGLLLFGLASVACAVAASIGVLLAGRAIQGAGAALLVPTALAILGSAFDARQRAMAIGTWAAASAIAGAAGPVLGGWLVDVSSWRAIFLINPPIVLVTLLLAWKFLVDEPMGDRAAGPGMDWTGAALITASLGLLSWGLIELGAGWRSTVAWASVVVGALLACVFVALEFKQGPKAMMPLDLFRSTAFAAANLLTLLLYAALAGLMLLLPFLLIRVGGWEAVEAGAALLPLPVTIGFLSRSAGTLSERYGARWFLAGGPLTVAAGMLLLLRVEPTQIDYVGSVLPALMVISLGMAFTVAPLTTTVIGSVERDQAGVASGVNNAIARIAALLAGALVGPVLARAGDPAAFVNAMHIAAGVSAGFVATGAVISAWMMRGPRVAA